MDKNRRRIVAGLGLAALSAAMGHAAPGPLTQGAQGLPHSLVLAPIGRGKGVGVAFPNLLTFKGPVVVLGVKGDSSTVPDPSAEGPSGD